MNKPFYTEMKILNQNFAKSAAVGTDIEASEYPVTWFLTAPG